MAKKVKKDVVVESAVLVAAVAAVPFVGPVLKLGRAAYQAYQEARFDRLWAYIAEHDTDPEDLKQRVEHALLKDGSPLGVAFVAAARAATEAYDPVVIQSIALLAHKFIRAGVPSRAAYRDLLNVFVVLAIDEFLGLRAAVHTLRAVPRVKGGGPGEPAAPEPGTIHGDERVPQDATYVVVNLHYERTAQSWVWYAIQTQQTWELARGELAIRLVDILEGLGRQHFSNRTQGEHDTPARKSIVQRSTIDLLAEIMPMPVPT
jgi:hypothetical protein